jgi:hypothetical protein
MKKIIVLSVSLLFVGTSIVYAEDVVKSEIDSILVTASNGRQIKYIDASAIEDIAKRVKHETLQEAHYHPTEVANWDLQQHGIECSDKERLNTSSGTTFTRAECSIVIDVAPDPAEHGEKHD